MKTYSEEKWRDFGSQILTASGVAEEEAEIIVDVLVTGSLFGIDSHGVRNIPYFAKSDRRKKIRIIKETPATTLIDANQVSGPFSTKKAMEMTIKKGKTQGTASCSIVNGDWITNLFYYSLMAVKENMIGIIVAREGPVCAPWGGIKSVTGTNPMSIGIPADKENPIILDFATTQVAQGHVKSVLLEGKPIPEGWLIDNQGNPVKDFDLNLEDLDEFWETGGSLLPFGTYKGYGINVAIDILGGALNLSGTGIRAKGQGVYISVIDIEAFTSIKEFKEEVDRLISDIKSSPVRPGFKEVLLPGEREFRKMEVRKNEGIPIDDKSWQDILDLCNENHMSVEKIMA